LEKPLNFRHSRRTKEKRKRKRMRTDHCHFTSRKPCNVKIIFAI